MKLVSVNLGLPVDMPIRDTSVYSGIFKAPVAGPVKVRRLNLDGDGQADLNVHGGPDKAVYAYPSEHYPFWEPTLGRLDWSAFGEYLTVTGLTEESVSVGDQIRIGTAVFAVTQPGPPWFKLAAKF